MNISMDIKLTYNAARTMANACLTEKAINRIKDIMWNFPTDRLTVRTAYNTVEILSAYHPYDSTNGLISFYLSEQEAQNVSAWIASALPIIL